MLSIVLSTILELFIGGTMYGGIEILFDNTSHRSMVLIGGLALTLGGRIDNIINVPYAVNCFLVATIIILLEYLAGRVWNKDFSIWDYRGEKFNLHGQICLKFYLVWLCVFSHVIIFLDELIWSIDVIEVLTN